MTVKETVAMLGDADEIYLVWNGSLHELDTKDSFAMMIHGPLLVSQILQGYTEEADKKSYELVLAAMPIGGYGA